jgi:hypothetical protein
MYDDLPPQPDADVVIRCFKNGVIEVPNEGTIINIPNWTLEYDHATTFFRFVPDKVFDCDLSQLFWAIVDNTAASLSHEIRLVGGKRICDLYYDMAAYTPFDDFLVTGVGTKLTNMMRVRIVKTV